ncbi:MAG: hypothetical protein WCG85_15035, partial [Polyangia bacterium]
STLTVSCPGSAGVAAVALLAQTEQDTYLCPCQLAVADFLSAGRAGWRGYGLRRVGGGPGAFSAAV